MKPSVNGVLHYLWRAVDQDGDDLDILVQKRKDKKAPSYSNNLRLILASFSIFYIVPVFLGD